MMEMASNLQSCLTPSKQTIKCWIKFSTSNCWQSAARSVATAGFMHCPYYHNMYSYIESHSPVYSAVCSRCVKQSIANFCSWVFSTLELRIFIVETYMRGKTYQKCSRKFRIQFPPFQFLPNEACLTTEEVTTSTYASKWKVVFYML